MRRAATRACRSHGPGRGISVTARPSEVARAGADGGAISSARLVALPGSARGAVAPLDETAPEHPVFSAFAIASGSPNLDIGRKNLTYLTALIVLLD